MASSSSHPILNFPEEVERGTSARPRLSFWRRAYRHCLTVQQWNVGFWDNSQFSPLAQQIGKPVRWCKRRHAAELVADPFLLLHESEIYLLAEYRDYPWQPAAIGAWKIRSGELEYLGVVIEETGVHLSYPFLFRQGGDIYCLPERNQAGSPILYRARQFPLAWEPLGEIQTGQRLIDPTVIFQNGRWWMFTTNLMIDPDGALEIWHADTPLGSWRPHARNPVKIDRRTSRGAGACFRWQDMLIRPVQDCSASYGARTIFMHVERLSETEFEETPVGELRPDPRGAYPNALHTLARLDNIWLVDGKRHAFTLLAIYFKWRIRRRHNSLSHP